MANLNKKQEEQKNRLIEEYTEGDKVFCTEEVLNLLEQAREEREHLSSNVKELDVRIEAYKELLQIFGEYAVPYDEY